MTDKTSFDIATRVAAGDDGTNYDSVAISLHWAVALLVLVQFVSAITWDYFPQGTREMLQGLHVSLGVLLAALIIIRIVWRLIPGHQLSPLKAGWVSLASKAVHYLLYFLLVAQVVTGFLFRWAQGHAVSFFGIQISNPFGAFSRNARFQLHAIHEWIGWTIIIVAFIHAMAALYHHYVLRDRVLARMFPPARGQAVH